MGVRVKMEIDDQVSEELRKMGEKSLKVLEHILFGASLQAKKKVQGSMRQVLTERTGKMMKGVRFKRTGKARYRLQGPRLGSVYEYNGAQIFPKTADLLRWRDERGNWRSSNFVFIEPRPFFYPTMREFVSSGEFDRYLAHRLGIEMDKEVKL